MECKLFTKFFNVSVSKYSFPVKITTIILLLTGQVLRLRKGPWGFHGRPRKSDWSPTAGVRPRGWVKRATIASLYQLSIFSLGKKNNFMNVPRSTLLMALV